MSEVTTIDFYVSTEGNDSWSGRLDEPNADKTDGPFATLAGARDALRKLKQAGQLAGPITVLVRGGRYLLTEPVVFTPEDSWPTTYAAYPGEEPILDGGRRIEGWRMEKRRPTPVWVSARAMMIIIRPVLLLLLRPPRSSPKPI